MDLATEFDSADGVPKLFESTDENSAKENQDKVGNRAPSFRATCFRLTFSSNPFRLG